jgi:cytochrome c biogenesis protein CcmG, thiol:disulfide interchange protein DsbE
LQKRIWIILLITGMIIGGAWNGGAPRAQAEPGVTVGKTMPSFSLNGPDGQFVQVGASGKPYVLNFWASWCPPCRDEFPDMNQFASEHSGSIQFYAINLGESAATATGFLQANGYTVAVLLDQNGTVAETFRVRSIPTTIVVDSQGVIRFRKTGGVSIAELETVIKGL